MINRKALRDQLLGYLNHHISAAQLVDWAENIMNEGDLDPNDASLLAEIIARIGAADVENFGLTWEDCYGFLSQLGYKVEVVTA